jgi:hypothetical protein
MIQEHNHTNNTSNDVDEHSAFRKQAFLPFTKKMFYPHINVQLPVQLSLHVLITGVRIP